MANIEKLRENLAILDGKIAVLRERREAVHARLKEAEGLEVLRLVDVYKLDYHGIKQLLEDREKGRLVYRDEMERTPDYEE